MNINLFEKVFKKKLFEYENVWGKDQRTLHLFEEVGEFSEILLQYQGHKLPSKNIMDIKIALADVLEDVLALSVLYEIRFNDLFDQIINEKRNKTIRIWSSASSQGQEAYSLSMFFHKLKKENKIKD